MTQQLDERVAIEVMGWHEKDGDWLDERGKFQAFTPFIIEDDELLGAPIWQPSKQIEQAWMIFEQLEGDWQLNAVGGKYMLWQEKTLGPWADTAPMAICLAALEATGGGA